MKFIPLSVPNFNGNELKYATNAIKEEWVSTGGEYINTFEDEISKYLNVKSAVACQSGTAGLHLSLLLSGVGNGDEVIAPTLTFIAAINPIKYVGADPIFMDCDYSLTIDIKKVREFCINQCSVINGKLINNKTKKHIKAIVVVHVFGNIADMEEIMNIAKTYNLKVIEDSTEALGSKVICGKYKGRYAGTIGDFGVYSFNGNKIITTGGGGMIVSNDNILLKKARYLSTQAKDDSLRYIHNEIGYNYRMTNLQAALGVAQLEQLDGFIKVKKENYNFYKVNLEKNTKLSLLPFKEGIDSNYWFYSLLIENSLLKRDELIDYLMKNNIQARPIWDLIHKQQPYKECKSYKIEKAEYYLDKIINIPCSTNLQREEIQMVIDVLSNIERR